MMDEDEDEDDDEDDDDDDGDDDDYDDDDDFYYYGDGDERKVMMWMLRRRRRKMLMLRRMMLRRKADLKAGKHTLCEPAQSKRAWTLHKSHFVWKCDARFVRACAVEMHMDMSEDAFWAGIYRENAGR